MPRGNNYRQNPHQLTDRQIEIFRLASQGLSNREIGEKIYVVENTVDTHLRLGYKKLGTSSRAGAIALGIREGWIPLHTGDDLLEDAAIRLYCHIYFNGSDAGADDFGMEPEDLKEQMRGLARAALNIKENS